jgi:hypothetical protein
MSGLALMEVQRALYTKLNSDGVLMGMVSGVHDQVPQHAALPYIELGDGAQGTVPSDDVLVTECRLRIDIWTEIGGRKTALAIMNRIHALVHLGTLSLSGYELVLLRCEQAETSLAERGQRIRGTLVLTAAVAEV